MDKIVWAVIGMLFGVVLTSIVLLQFGPSASLTGNVISAPTGNILQDNITAFPDRVVIMIDNATVSNYADTGSMLPLIDSKAHGIRIVPKSVNQINVGDLVTFNESGKMIVHRVVVKSTDSQGIYFITRGDNSQVNDNMIRFSDIKYKTVGILY
jgi:hypothetical protein